MGTRGNTIARLVTREARRQCGSRRRSTCVAPRDSGRRRASSTACAEGSEPPLRTADVYIEPRDRCRSIAAVRASPESLGQSVGAGTAAANDTGADATRRASTAGVAPHRFRFGRAARTVHRFVDKKKTPYPATVDSG